MTLHCSDEVFLLVWSSAEGLCTVSHCIALRFVCCPDALCVALHLCVRLQRMGRALGWKPASRYCCMFCCMPWHCGLVCCASQCCAALCCVALAVLVCFVMPNPTSTRTRDCTEQVQTREGMDTNTTAFSHTCLARMHNKCEHTVTLYGRMDRKHTCKPAGLWQTCFGQRAAGRPEKFEACRTTPCQLCITQHSQSTFVQADACRPDRPAKKATTARPVRRKMPR